MIDINLLYCPSITILCLFIKYTHATNVKSLVITMSMFGAFGGINIQIGCRKQPTQLNK